MAPTRSGTIAARRKNKSSNRADEETSQNSVLPGVQKIKSSLRQTRRLLAKDDLAADVRIETERRLKSLESELARAERTRKERNLAVKYHKVKFFERQKVCRKLRQAKRELDDADIIPDNLPALREALFSHRVDLNYILHYPKTKKYISLFPPDGTKVAGGTGSSDTDKTREDLRRWVRTAMEKGEMDAEPELTKDKRRPPGEAMECEDESKPRPRVGKKEKQVTSKPKGVSGDAFFEASDGEEQSQSDDG